MILKIPSLNCSPRNLEFESFYKKLEGKAPGGLFLQGPALILIYPVCQTWYISCLKMFIRTQQILTHKIG